MTPEERARLREQGFEFDDEPAELPEGFEVDAPGDPEGARTMRGAEEQARALGAVKAGGGRLLDPEYVEAHRPGPNRPRGAPIAYDRGEETVLPTTNITGRRDRLPGDTDETGITTEGDPFVLQNVEMLDPRTVAGTPEAQAEDPAAWTVPEPVRRGVDAWARYGNPVGLAVTAGSNLLNAQDAPSLLTATPVGAALRGGYESLDREDEDLVAPEEVSPRAFGHGVVQGATLSGADELVGLADEQAGREAREQTEASAARYPASFGAGQIAGSAPLIAVPGLGSAPALQGVGRGAALARTAATAGEGAALGYTQGALAGRPGEREESAETGALYGLAGGALAGGAVNAPAVLGSRRIADEMRVHGAGGGMPAGQRRLEQAGMGMAYRDARGEAEQRALAAMEARGVEPWHEAPTPPRAMPEDEPYLDVTSDVADVEDLTPLAQPDASDEARSALAQAQRGGESQAAFEGRLAREAETLEERAAIERAVEDYEEGLPRTLPGVGGEARQANRDPDALVRTSPYRGTIAPDESAPYLSNEPVPWDPVASMAEPLAPLGDRNRALGPQRPPPSPGASARTSPEIRGGAAPRRAGRVEAPPPPPGVDPLAATDPAALPDTRSLRAGGTRPIEAPAQGNLTQPDLGPPTAVDVRAPTPDPGYRQPPAAPSRAAPEAPPAAAAEIASPYASPDDIDALGEMPVRRQDRIDAQAAIARRIRQYGYTGATPEENLRRAAQDVQRAGADMDALTAQAPNMVTTQRLARHFDRLAAEADEIGSPGAQAYAAEAERFRGLGERGLTFGAAHRLRQNLDQQARFASQQPNLDARAYREARRLLAEDMEASLPPDMARAWRSANERYQVAKLVEQGTGAMTQSAERGVRPTLSQIILLSTLEPAGAVAALATPTARARIPGMVAGMHERLLAMAQRQPWRLGRWGDMLARAARSGPATFNAVHEQLTTTSPEYRAHMRSLDNDAGAERSARQE